MISKISSCPENQDQDDTKDILMVRKVFGRAMIMMLPILQGYIKSLFEEYIELYPNGYNPYDSMGEFYYNEGDLENAKLYYSKAVEKYYAATVANGRLNELND